MIKKKLLDIKRLSGHQFITKEVKNFTRIDKKEVGNNLSCSQIIFNLNYSTNPYFHDADIEIDEIKKKYADDLIKASTKIKEITKIKKPEKDLTKIKTPEGNKDEEKLNKEIEKLILDSIAIYCSVIHHSVYSYFIIVKVVNFLIFLNALD